MISLTASTFERAVAQVTARDQDLAQAVARWGMPPFWTREPGFPGLVLAILSQQISLESAHAAYSKLCEQVDPLTPEGLLLLKDATLKDIGFSRQKTNYVRGLAAAIVDGTLDLDAVARMDNETARKALVTIRGIGPWTADTYLLFSLRRADVWPSGDLALAKAIQQLRDLASTLSYAEVDAIAEDWRPWRAVAARILWHHYLSKRGR